MARNMLKCVLSGRERITNKSYLSKRMALLNCDEQTFRSVYITTSALSHILAELKVPEKHKGPEAQCTVLLNIADQLNERIAQTFKGSTFRFTGANLLFALRFNGKHQDLLRNIAPELVPARVPLDPGAGNASC